VNQGGGTVQDPRDHARRNQQQFEALLRELETQDGAVAELYEQAGLDRDAVRGTEAPAELTAAFERAAEPTEAPREPTESKPLRGFVVRV
jgi:hypothetical protein